MGVFCEYELKVMKLLVASHFGSEELDAIINESEFVSFEHTVVGYYLTVSHPIIPKKRTVCDKPNVTGIIDDGIICGFLIFLMDNKLTIECFSYTGDTIPEDIRSRNVTIEIVNLTTKSIVSANEARLATCAMRKQEKRIQMNKETYWSRFANDYEDRVNYVVGNSDIELMKSYLAEQKSLGKTLELGCGSGTYSEILMCEAEHLTATDFSDEMVAVSSQRLEGKENVCVEKADCFNLSYPDSSFDTVCMANLLHIIGEPEKAIAEGRRVLKENGRLIIISFTTEGMTFLNKIGMTFRYLKSFGKPPPTAYPLTTRKAQEMLKNCRFKIEEIKLMGNKSKTIFIKAINDK